MKESLKWMSYICSSKWDTLQNQRSCFPEMLFLSKTWWVSSIVTSALGSQSVCLSWLPLASIMLWSLSGLADIESEHSSLESIISLSPFCFLLCVSLQTGSCWGDWSREKLQWKQHPGKRWIHCRDQSVLSNTEAPLCFVILAFNCSYTSWTRGKWSWKMRLFCKLVVHVCF